LSTECLTWLLMLQQMRKVCYLKHYKYLLPAIHNRFSFLIGPNDVVCFDLHKFLPLTDITLFYIGPLTDCQYVNFSYVTFSMLNVCNQGDGVPQEDWCQSCVSGAGYARAGDPVPGAGVHPPCTSQGARTGPRLLPSYLHTSWGECVVMAI